MSSRLIAATRRLGQSAVRPGQAAFFVIVFLLASKAATFLDLPVSGGVLGLFVVLAMLLGGIVETKHVEAGAALMLGELVLFFIPSVVALTRYLPLFREFGVQLLVSIVTGTILVMATTATTVHLVGRFSKASSAGEPASPGQY